MSLKQEGFETLIEVLENLFITDPDLLICKNCYETQEDCRCLNQDKVYWPLNLILIKLRLEYDLNDV